VRGATNREIAEALVVTDNTVKYHLKNILQKLHLHNRAQVVAYALKHGISRA
jgi:DNA-binding NarL/FixJ family response regulator